MLARIGGINDLGSTYHYKTKASISTMEERENQNMALLPPVTIAESTGVVLRGWDTYALNLTTADHKLFGLQPGFSHTGYD